MGRYARDVPPPPKKAKAEKTATMATTSIRQEINGVIAHIDYYSGGYLKILAANGARYSVHQNRIVNAP
jgi:hypothetical protein